jgi:hypothetical protein
MDAGVVSGFRPQASLRERRPRELKPGPGSPGAFRISRLPVAERPPQPKVAEALRRKVGIESQGLFDTAGFHDEKAHVIHEAYDAIMSSWPENSQSSFQETA